VQNTYWIAGDSIYAYTENPKLWQSIRRYYPDYREMAIYSRNGKVFARQYRIPKSYKRTVKRQFT
jgi:hypothetical protein